MDFRPHSQIDLITVSSVGLRMTPQNRMPVTVSRTYELQATSAETNVLNVAASLGRPTKVLTRFVKDSPVSFFIKGELRRRNIAFEGPDIPQGGPWGYRHQINIADAGFGYRAPLVWNDRAGEVGRDLTPEDFDLERIFAQDGAKILHLSGLVAALSPEATRACVEIATYAKAHGTHISFDLNHRASFWEGRGDELRQSFTEIAKLATILIGNEEDFQLALGLEGPPSGHTSLSGNTDANDDTNNDNTDTNDIDDNQDAQKMDAFKGMIERASEQFPDVEVFATTLRHVESSNTHMWGALLRKDGAWAVEAPRPIEIMDRIGGGDGFVGGLLYALITDKPATEALQFAWATGAMAASVTDDFATPTSEEDVRAIYQGNARVKR